MNRAVRHGSSAVAIVAIAVAGCGSSHKSSSHESAPTEQQQQVERVLHSYLQAQTGGDGQTACSLLTGAAQRQLENLVVQASNGLLPTRPSCQHAVGLVHTFAGGQLLDALAKAEIAQVRVEGDSATAEVSAGAPVGKQQVSLERSGGTWKIAGVPGLTG